MISRKILDIMTIWYDIQKVSRYHRRIYRKILDIILHRVDIQKVSQNYPLQGGYSEFFRVRFVSSPKTAWQQPNSLKLERG